jgi:hypothetical protein
MTSGSLVAELGRGPTLTWRSLLRVVLPLAALPVFVALALPEYSTLQRFLAWLVFTVGTAPILRFFERPVFGHVPLIELVGLQYALFFALPVFYESRLQVAGAFYILPASGPITLALSCALLAFVAVLIGQGMTRRFVNLRLRVVQFAPSSHRLFVYGVVVTLSALALGLTGFAGTALAAGPMKVLLPQTLGLAILASLYYAGGLSPVRRLVAVGVFLASMAFGLLSSSTTLLVEPVVIWALARWVLAGKSPAAVALMLVAIFVLLQPIKGRYRSSVGMRTFTAKEALGLYVALTRLYWTTGRETSSIAQEARESASHRLSLLMSTAHYIQLTPRFVSYHGPRTVLYPTYSWVPRVLWPDKPTAQEANSRLPVEYGIQAPDNVALTMFGVGHVAEVYTAFGLAAIIPVFLILGALYATPTVVLRAGQSVATTALLIWFAMNMLQIESTIGNVFGSLFQQLVVQCVLLSVFTRAPRSTASA